MLTTELPENEPFRGHREKFDILDDYADVPEDFWDKVVLTSEGFREKLVFGYFPDVTFTDED